MKLKKLVVVLLWLPLMAQAQQITKGEYFIDTDPGLGKGLALPAFTASDSVAQTVTLNTTGLSVGFHLLYYRYRYNTGAWGIPESVSFYVYDTTYPVPASPQPVVAKGEYFVDTDPGVGKGTALPSFVSSDSVSQAINLNTTGLGVGYHYVYYRYKDLQGKWGLPESLLFFVYDTTGPTVAAAQPQIAKGEYFVDTDPGVGKGTALPAFISADSVSQTFDIVTSPSFTVGSKHVLYLRYMDKNGKWGHAEPSVFNIQNCSLSVTASAAKTAICSGATTTINSSSVSQNLTYQWYKNNVATSITTSSFTANSAGIYTVVAMDALGCMDTSNVVTITANALPTVSLNLSTNNRICLSGGTKTLTGGSPAGGTYSGKGVSGTTYNPTTAGVGRHTITYSYMDGNTCTNTATDTIRVDVCAGIEESTSESNVISIYPNPTSGQFTVLLPTNEAEIIITDMLGQQVLKTHATQKMMDFQLEQNVYIVYVKTNQGTTTKKLIVNR